MSLSRSIGAAAFLMLAAAFFVLAGSVPACGGGGGGGGGDTGTGGSAAASCDACAKTDACVMAQTGQMGPYQATCDAADASTKPTLISICKMTVQLEAMKPDAPAACK